MPAPASSGAMLKPSDPNTITRATMNTTNDSRLRSTEPMVSARARRRSEMSVGSASNIALAFTCTLCNECGSPSAVLVTSRLISRSPRNLMTSAKMMVSRILPPDDVNPHQWCALSQVVTVVVAAMITTGPTRYGQR